MSTLAPTAWAQCGVYRRRALYPPDWPQIAHTVKAAANWTCQQCGQRCYRPGERVRDWHRVLTVAHLDRDPAHNAPENLKALRLAGHRPHSAGSGMACVVCHLNYDRVVNVRAARCTRFLRRAGPMLPLPWTAQE